MQIFKGGPGSGHFGHRGRPGKRGGSAPSSEIRAYLTSPEGARRVQALSDVEREGLISILENYPVPPSHLETVRQIVTDPDDLIYKRTPYEAGGLYPEEAEADWEYAPGWQIPSTNELLFMEPEKTFTRYEYRPGIMLGPNPSLVLHELGHNMFQVRFMEPRGMSREDVEEWAEPVRDALLSVRWPQYRRPEGDLWWFYGLREFGLEPGGGAELGADMYNSWMHRDVLTGGSGRHHSMAPWATQEMVDFFKQYDFDMPVLYGP